MVHPSGQFRHSPWPPIANQLLGQFMHVVESLSNFPSGHASHVVVAVSLWCRPSAQASHPVETFESWSMVPGRHTSQRLPPTATGATTSSSWLHQHRRRYEEEEEALHDTPLLEER